MSPKYASVLLRTFLRVFCLHYKYFIPFWLALVACLVFLPLIIVFGKVLTGQGIPTEVARHSIASLMGPLLTVYDSTTIAIFSTAVLIAMFFDEIRWGVAEHILCTAPISVGRLILLKSLICVLLTVPMALCIVAVRILFIHLFIGPNYLCYIAPLHIALLLVNSFSATLALVTIYMLLLLLIPLKYRTALSTGLGLILAALHNIIVSRALLHPETISAGDLYTYTAISTVMCVSMVTLIYRVAERLSHRAVANIIAP